MMMPSKEEREARDAKVVDLYRQGLSFREIEERTGVDKMVAVRAVHRAEGRFDEERYRAQAEKDYGAKKAKRDARDAKIAEMVRQGISLRAIAEELKTGRTEIYRVLDRLGISLDAVAEAKAQAPKRPVGRKHGEDKEPNQWPASWAITAQARDRFWGLYWGRLGAEKFNEFVLELTRTPGEYSRNGGDHWSPTHAELAA